MNHTEYSTTYEGHDAIIERAKKDLPDSDPYSGRYAEWVTDELIRTENLVSRLSQIVNDCRKRLDEVKPLGS